MCAQVCAALQESVVEASAVAFLLSLAQWEWVSEVHHTVATVVKNPLPKREREREWIRCQTTTPQHYRERQTADDPTVTSVIPATVRQWLKHIIPWWRDTAQITPTALLAVTVCCVWPCPWHLTYCLAGSRSGQPEAWQQILMSPTSLYSCEFIFIVVWIGSRALASCGTVCQFGIVIRRQF